VDRRVIKELTTKVMERSKSRAASEMSEVGETCTTAPKIMKINRSTKKHVKTLKLKNDDFNFAPQTAK
jgi:hypothetical protein